MAQHLLITRNANILCTCIGIIGNSPSCMFSKVFGKIKVAKMFEFSH